MRYVRFDIKNFRGIIDASVSLEGHPTSRVYTLVGLNESGKTTVLEAINHSAYKTGELAALKPQGYSTTDLHSLIPISKRANFNETIEIAATIELDDEDELGIRQDVQRETGFLLAKPIGQFRVARQLVFANSRHVPGDTSVYWWITLEGKAPRQRKARPLPREAWLAALKPIIKRVPDILFFPNFLFEFPERIYLAPRAGDEVGKFYNLVLQDILDALGNATTVETHIHQRAKSGNTNDKTSLDGLLLEMSRHVTQTVFSTWDQMFQQQQIAQKRVTLTCDADEEGRHFISLRLEDHDGFYQIRERSLGFRWFFTFLLLTHYRGFRERSSAGVLFLLDEPASNLHSTAQARLLQSFSKLPERCGIIYTTHSHHLINPRWLETTFVVRNEGLDYATDAVDYSAKKTDITVSRYREFVAAHPSQTSYFQPILDVLDYAPSVLEDVPAVVMAEGKTDFYLFKYLAAAIGTELRLLPGSGAGSLETAIQLYLAWCRAFVVLLDSDAEGGKQKARYRETFGAAVDNRITGIRDLVPDLAGTRSEALLEEADRFEIQRVAFPDDACYEKKHFHRSLQELVARNETLPLSEPSRSRAETALAALKGMLASQSGN